MIYKANLHDTKIGWWATGLVTFTYPTLKKICEDGGYRGSFVFEAYKYFCLQVEISKKLKGYGWQVLPKRWIVEAHGSVRWKERIETRTAEELLKPLSLSLGYEPNSREEKETANRRNGYFDKTIKTSMGELQGLHRSFEKNLRSSEPQSKPGRIRAILPNLGKISRCNCRL